MPDNKSDVDGAGLDEPPDKDNDLNDSEFAEIDPTGRYGRYKEVLGKGAFKTVYRAFDEVDGIEVAWNQVKIQDLLQSPEELERLYSEVHLLKSLKHKNIIKLYNSWVDTKNKNVNFITEIFTSGTLRQYRKKHKHVDIKAVKNWARQILRGLLYLHSHDPPIIHRDLKCDNIFVNGNHGEVKIGDLGLATILRQANAAHSVIGTPEFMAPELYEEEYNELVDIYSFGMCLLEMVTFEYPYSECTNAAQIYKKVSSGKKPAALERVKDPEVRQFIEKCLAVASKRLPARELLTDSFLQSEGSREPLECLLPMPRSELIGDDMEELVVIEESGTKHSGRDSNSGQTESFSGNSVVGCGSESGHSMSTTSVLPNGRNRRNSDMNCVRTPNTETCAPNLPSSISKDDQLRGSRDFRVKGKKRDENTIFLRLRIVDSQSHIRNIHFLFDREGDTVMSVASEMLEELDLSAQDVTTISEMIDAEISALAPEWKPGASFDETGPDVDDSGDQVETIPEDSCEKVKCDANADVSGAVDEPLMERVPSTRKVQSPPFRPSTYDGSPTRGEGMMYGRFEEVTYNPGSSDYSPSSSGAPPPLSSNSSEIHADEESRYHHGDPISPVSDYIGTGTWSTVVESMPSPHIDYPTFLGDTEPCEIGPAAFNELVESQRNAGCIKYTHQTWEGIMNIATGPEGEACFIEGDRCGLSESDSVQPPPPNTEYQLVLDIPPDLTGGEEEDLDRELKLLTLKQEDELRELQRKHEQAVQEVRNRWGKKSGSTLSSHLASPDRLQYDSIMKFMATEQVANCSGNQARPRRVIPPLEHEEKYSSAVKLGRTNRETIESDRLSLKELAAMTARVAAGEMGQLTSSVLSCSGAASVAQDAVGLYELGTSGQMPVVVDSNTTSRLQASGVDDVAVQDISRDAAKCGELLGASQEPHLQGLTSSCSSWPGSEIVDHMSLSEKPLQSQSDDQLRQHGPFGRSHPHQNDISKDMVSDSNCVVDIAVSHTVAEPSSRNIGVVYAERQGQELPPQFLCQERCSVGPGPGSPPRKSCLREQEQLESDVTDCISDVRIQEGSGSCLSKVSNEENRHLGTAGPRLDTCSGRQEVLCEGSLKEVACGEGCRMALDADAKDRELLFEKNRLSRERTSRVEESKTACGSGKMNPVYNAATKKVAVGGSSASRCEPAVESSAQPGSSDGQREPVDLASSKSARSDQLHTRVPDRTDQVGQGRRESYTEFYKTGGLEREKLCSSKVDTRSTDASAQELLSKPSSSKSDDRALELLKKEQLQKSIAKLEAKTLEGLHCSKHGFLANHAPKKPLGGSSVQSGSGGSTASQARPHSVSESNKV